MPRLRNEANGSGTGAFFRWPEWALWYCAVAVDGRRPLLLARVDGKPECRVPRLRNEANRSGTGAFLRCRRGGRRYGAVAVDGGRPLLLALVDGTPEAECLDCRTKPIARVPARWR